MPKLTEEQRAALELTSLEWRLNGDPYQVQMLGAEKAIKCARSAGIRGFGFCMEMGLGKTATAINDFIHFNAESLIIICPNSLKTMWTEQLKMWMPLEIYNSYDIYTAPDYPKEFRGRNEIVIVNYEGFSIGKAHAAKMFQEFVGRHYIEDTSIQVIFDESTQIKNPKAKRTKMIHKLIDDAWNEKGVLLRATMLSGNPTPNDLSELWAQLYVIGGTENIGYYTFRNTFCKVGGYQGKKVIGTNLEMKDYFDKIVEKRVFFALKKDWTDLPDKNYIVRKGEMGPIQKERYLQMQNEMQCYIAQKDISEDSISFIDASWILVQMGKLRQLSSGFIRDTHGEPPEDYEFEDPKIDMIKEDLAEISGKTIIVVHYKNTMRKLTSHLLHLNPAFIGGGMDIEELEENKRRFNGDPDCRIIICQCASAKFGHTLLGIQSDLVGGADAENVFSRNDACHTTIFYENDFSYESRSQMEDRNHRIGQKRMVTYIDYSLSPIDEVIRSALLTKQKVHQRLVQHLKTIPMEVK